MENCFATHTKSRHLFSLINQSPFFFLPVTITSPLPMNSSVQFPAFSDSDNSSSIILYPETLDTSSPDIESLRRLSDHLFSLIQSPDFDIFSDARISVGPNELAVHRCVLSARSSFFRDVFAGKEEASGRPVRVELKELVGDEFDVGFEALVFVINYIYSGRMDQLPKDVCMCADDECFHVGCRPAVSFMLEVLFASFTFKISELVSLFQRHLLHILDKIAIEEIPVILCVANFCSIACERLLIKCVEIVVKSDMDIVTLEKALPQFVVKQVMETRSNLCLRGVEGSGLLDKHVRRIYKALDSDDIKLLKMLLEERHTSLDDAYALHYAVAYCDTKTTMELLDYGHADVNHMNPRGYTVLHVAAMRKQPKIIVSLLTNGARPSDLTLDGRKAVQIAKRVTKSVDYYRARVDGRASLEEGRLCIGILEHAEKRNPLIGEVFSLAMAGNDQHGILLYLENRVALARMLFPMEAKVAMDIAQVDGTLEFTLGTTASQRSTVDLNKEPFKIKEEHVARIKALSRTVELGKRFFPRCSEYLDKIMDDHLFELAFVGPNASVEQMKRYLELQDDINRAFSEDKEKFDKSALSSPSSSSTSETVVRKRNRVWV